MKETYAELDIILAEEHWVSSQHCDGSLSRDSGSGASLAEHHSHGLSSHAAGQLYGRLASLQRSLV